MGGAPLLPPEFFEAGDIEIEGERDERAESPADSPRPADARKAERNGENEHESHAQNEVGKGTYGKAEVAARAAHGVVGDDLYVYYQEEGRDDSHILRAAVDGEHDIAVGGHEQFDELAGENFAYGDEHRRHYRGDDERRLKALLYARIFARAVALRNEVGKPVGARTEAGGAEHDKFYARGETVGNSQPLHVCKFVDAYLYDEVAHRNETVLKHYGEGEYEQRF